MAGQIFFNFHTVQNSKTKSIEVLGTYSLNNTSLTYILSFVVYFTVLSKSQTMQHLGKINLRGT